VVHELAITQSVVDTITERTSGARVTLVRLSVGGNSRPGRHHLARTTSSRGKPSRGDVRARVHRPAGPQRGWHSPGRTGGGFSYEGHPHPQELWV